MIGSIRGKVIFKTEKFVIVETGGIGYKVTIGPEAMSRIKEGGGEVILWTHTHVREDILDLYGFFEYEELEFFEMLINISGIGPKGAIAILGIAPIDTLKSAISTGDLSYLTKISGIGKKTAEKIVLELRDKVGTKKENGSLKEELDTLEALKALGYSQHEAREALKQVENTSDTNTKIKQALKILGGK